MNRGGKSVGNTDKGDLGQRQLGRGIDLPRKIYGTCLPSEVIFINMAMLTISQININAIYVSISKHDFHW